MTAFQIARYMPQRWKNYFVSGSRLKQCLKKLLKEFIERFGMRSFSNT